MRSPGTATAKTKEAANIAGQKANQVCQVRGGTTDAHIWLQAAAGAREGKEDFKADVKKELRK